MREVISDDKLIYIIGLGGHSNIMERIPGYIKTVLDSYNIKKDDVTIIVNAY
jgi:uncharacterized phosphosugar-binding protein